MKICHSSLVVSKTLQASSSHGVHYPYHPVSISHHKHTPHVANSCGWGLQSDYLWGVHVSRVVGNMSPALLQVASYVPQLRAMRGGNGRSMAMVVVMVKVE